MPLVNYYQKYDLWHWAILVIAWALLSFFYFYLVFIGPAVYIKEGLVKVYTQGYGIVLEIAIFAIFFGSIHFMINHISRYWYFLRRGSIGKIIFFKTLFYVIGMVLVGLLDYQIFYWLDIVPREQLNALKKEVNPNFLVSNMIFFTVCILLFNFMGQISQKFGVGVLEKMLLGQYQKPYSENRIFMFLDLKSSTSIAEQLGHEQYGRFIQRLFSEITNIVRRYEAEVYQYAGDEIILTWTAERGLKNNNCLHLFFAFREKLNRKQLYYHKRFGVVPKFKAGIDVGKVTRVEVGEIKRDIGYYGDVLNTAARVQSKCNELGKDLLISARLHELLPKDKNYQFEYLGELPLKGKQSEVGIYAPFTAETQMQFNKTKTA